ncbi:Olfactory receptor 1020 [Sciurus carolinensis]|uniref:Olfactory receptor 1020 n=1 Tax=Sciurus carolinensis TaxID=30640 RepID=A0AA41MTS4_SCICA|nr:Olfactory receptor 1020 [Sciurus carolinensis]
MQCPIFSLIAVQVIILMKEIQRRNLTEVTEFVLLGLSDNLHLQGVLFALFLSIYVATMVGNLGMMALIKMDPHLHTPMYFFLSSLSFVDASYSSSVTPKMLVNLVAADKINHFYRDTPPLLKLSCSDTHINGIVIMVFSSFQVISCVVTVLISYLCILIAILKMRSVEGRRKAFSTCASHLVAVTIFFGTILFMYLRPTSSYSMEQDKVVSVFYTVIIPMLNPLIYSLKNKDVKEAVKKILQKHIL